MKTERIQVSDPQDQVLTQAAKHIEAGELVAFPTETVYGIACRASADAINRLDQIKGRTPDKHYTLHVGEVSQLQGFLELTSLRVAKLAQKAWPGPLTMVFDLTEPARQYVRHWLGEAAFEILCRDHTLGIRCPDHPVAKSLLSQAACAVVAPSANKTGQAPASDADQVMTTLNGDIHWILDAGPCPLKQSSAVVKIGGSGPVEILREGYFSRQAIDDMAQIQFLFVCTGNTCRSPMAEGIFRNMLAQHLSCNEVDDLSVLGYKIVSAGTMGMHGLPASEGAVAACLDRGIDITGHESRGLSARLIEESDFIFTMTHFHRDTVLALFPEASQRCVLLDVKGDIADPVGQPVTVYRACAVQIEDAIKTKLSELTL
ncbi:MAG: threonylcarbamoyl-AMP synthase [Phycisphaerae bacterium]|nr:threonylcarbamoyl-AMP synthase [Phycisphaerae bacterium]